MHSIFYGKCPDYLTNVASPIDYGRPRRVLRSSSMSDFSLPRLRTKFGEPAFTYDRPSAWNLLPENLAYVLSVILDYSENDLRHTFLVWLSCVC